MQVGVDQYVMGRPASHRAPRLANFQRGLQEPPGKGPAQLLPFGRQLIAPLLRPGGDVFELLPPGPVVRRKPQLPHQATPHRHGIVHGKTGKRPPGVEPFQQHGARPRIRCQQGNGATALPERQRMPFHQRLIMRKSDFEGRR